VPIQLALPDRGVVGAAGTLDVDVETGQIVVSTEEIVESASHAERLAV
jgi:hypothetical protein